MIPTKFRVSWPFSSGEEVKNRFQDGRHGGHLGFSTGTILGIFHLQVTLMIPTKFQVNWPFGSGEEAKNRFLGFLIYKSPQGLLPSFKSISLSIQEKKRKIDFQDGSHCDRHGFLNGRILAIFDLQVTPMLPTEFRVNWPFGSGEVKIDFQDGCHGAHLDFR